MPALSWNTNATYNSTHHDDTFDAARVYEDAVTVGGLNEEHITFDYGINITGGINLRYFEGQLTCGDGVCSRDELWQSRNTLDTSCEADCAPVINACVPPAVHDMPWATQPRAQVEARNSIYTMTKPSHMPVVRAARSNAHLFVQSEALLGQECWFSQLRDVCILTVQLQHQMRTRRLVHMK